MYCGNCGAKCADRDIFCGSCGARIVTEAAEAVPTVSVPVEPAVPVESAVPVEPAVTVEPTTEQPPTRSFVAPIAEINPDAASIFEQGLSEDLEQEPLAEAPRAQADDPAVPPTEQEPIPAPAKKPRKKGCLIGICLAFVLVLALVGGILSYIFIFNSPAYRIKAALENTTEELEDLLGNSENFLEFYRAYQLLAESGEISYDLDMEAEEADSDGWSSSEHYQFSLNYSKSNKQISGQFDSSTEENYGDEPYSSDISIAFSADEEQLLLKSSSLDNKLYSVPLKDFGKEFSGSYLSEQITNKDALDFLEAASFCLFPDIYWNDFSKNCPEATALTESLKLEKSKQAIADRTDLTVYSMAVDADLIIDAINAYMEFALIEVCGREAADQIPLRSIRATIADLDFDTLQIFIGIDDENRLAAICACPDDRSEEAIGISLEGKENIWNEIRLYSEDNEHTLQIVQTQNGFRISGGETKYDTLLECDDAARTLTVFEDGEETQIIKFRLEDDQIILTVEEEIDEIYSSYSTTTYRATTIRYMPLRKVDMLSGEASSIFDLNKESLSDILLS